MASGIRPRQPEHRVVVWDDEVAMTLEFTEWAVQILRRSHEAARRFNPDATVRMSRAGTGVRFDLTDRPGDGDERVQGDGFELLVQPGLSGLVDVVEPHDQLVLRPAGSAPNPR
jgi:hypothetical protein